jgi:hypothetical protein
MRTTLISAVATALVCCWQGFAQTSARATGVLADSSGALVPGAEIIIANLVGDSVQRLWIGGRQ